MLSWDSLTLSQVHIIIIILIIIIIIYTALFSYSFIALYIDYRYVLNISFNTQELHNPYDSFFFSYAVYDPHEQSYSSVYIYIKKT